MSVDPISSLEQDMALIEGAVMVDSRQTCCQAGEQ